MKRFSPSLSLLALLALLLAGCDLMGTGVDSQPPSLLITRPGEGALVAGETVRFYIKTTPGYGKTISGVSVRINEQEVGTAWPAGQENLYGFDWNAASVTPGAHRLSVTAVDNMGSRGYSPTVNLTVLAHDDAAPAARLLDPQPGAEVFDNVLLTAEVDAGVTKVGFMVNGAVEFLDDLAPFEFLWDTKREVVPQNALQVVAYSEGAVSVSPPITVKVLFEEGGQPSTGSTEPGKIFFSTTVRGETQGSAALGFKGEVYVGTSQKKLYSFDSNGLPRWEIDLGGAVHGSPIVGNDENVFVAAGDGKIYAFTRTGQELWSPYATNSVLRATPAYGVDGTLYVGDGDGVLHAVNSYTGRKKWTLALAQNAILVPPVISRDGLIFVAATDGFVYAVNQSGSVIWKSKTNVGTVYGGIALLETDVPQTLPNGSTTTIAGTALYVVAANKLVAISGANGQTMWSHDLDGPVQSAPVIGPDGTIYVGTNTGLVALNAILTGALPNRLRWVFNAPSVGTPVIDDNGTVYAVAKNRLVARNANNTPVWDVDLKAEVHGPLTIAPNGRLILVTTSGGNGLATAVNTGADGLAEKGWPMFQRNSRHTGRLGEDEKDI